VGDAPLKRRCASPFDPHFDDGTPVVMMARRIGGTALIGLAFALVRCAPMPPGPMDGAVEDTSDARATPSDTVSPVDSGVETDGAVMDTGIAPMDTGVAEDAMTPSDTGVSADTSTTPDVMSGDGGANRSAGCGRPSSGALGTFVARSIMVGGMMRDYYVRLPMGYDPNRAYPIVYQFHGCSTAAARQDNNVPLHNASGTNAIIVRGRAAGNCWEAAVMGPDIPYIDAMIADNERSVCVDTRRRFANGYSSGAFMTHRLGCLRGSLFRGVGSIAGGQSGSMCTGNVAAMLIHDTGDSTVNVSASISARDNHVMRNGCNAMAARTPVMPMPCESYAGCMPGLPVVWCQTTGQNHGRQDGLAAPAFWNFFNSLPSR
jgi:polyhydroxybutyrate depolymerase